MSIPTPLQAHHVTVVTLVNKPTNGLNTSKANTLSYQMALPWIWGRDLHPLWIRCRDALNTLWEVFPLTQSHLTPSFPCSSSGPLLRRAGAASPSQGRLSTSHCMQPLLILWDWAGLHIWPHFYHSQRHAPTLTLKTARTERLVPTSAHVMAKICTKTLQRFYEGNNEPFLLN